ncbi:hypothetical protein [Deinococcus soli (ex Cha et al. 2016)]|uniref:Uncharacterized protein n=2 Tax=Deinococcus soli (ex Cha et al. 2016) TaxID=1309411 RepID=A0AAE3XDF7_9DEIO|nr:hypothetical protein [Deinococcus soli (ex Cha et al. 2016)]MDR6218462.1 hypothetical protein [Deinococcus soli (ex Cha et al. 2016)]MDR6329202.1 hypothetical protein [Deinococcus soli (ex Cha et al. 2016)]MDR6751475.1 hypothetical protein [Deinococcus soli (ex Cha et al. 2016)]
MSAPNRKHDLRISFTATNTEVRSVDPIRLEGELVDIIASYGSDGQEVLFLVTPPYPRHLDHVPLTVRQAARLAVSHARHVLTADSDMTAHASRPFARTGSAPTRAEAPLLTEADSRPTPR